jgi:hypothetical protein
MVGVGWGKWHILKTKMYNKETWFYNSMKADIWQLRLTVTEPYTQSIDVTPKQQLLNFHYCYCHTHTQFIWFYTSEDVSNA